MNQQPVRMPAQLPAEVPDYSGAIIELSKMKDLDVVKLEKLIALQEHAEARYAEEGYSNALAAAEGEMEAVQRDANNPQTKSNYATLAALDGAIRPIYTKHGFGTQFTTEPGPDANSIWIVGFLRHGKHKERFQILMPIDTQGIRGGAMMTRTHAIKAATTYGRRTLECLMFNIAEEDADGNTKPGPQRGGGPQPARAQPMDHDPITGEIIDEHMPISFIDLDVTENNVETWVSWSQRFLARILVAPTSDHIDEWLKKHSKLIQSMRQDANQTYKLVEATVQRRRQELTLRGEPTKQQSQPPPQEAKPEQTKDIQDGKDGQDGQNKPKPE